MPPISKKNHQKKNAWMAAFKIISAKRNEINKIDDTKNVVCKKLTDNTRTRKISKKITINEHVLSPKSVRRVNFFSKFNQKTATLQTNLIPSVFENFGMDDHMYNEVFLSMKKSRKSNEYKKQDITPTKFADNLISDTFMDLDCNHYMLGSSVSLDLIEGRVDLVRPHLVFVSNSAVVRGKISEDAYQAEFNPDLIQPLMRSCLLPFIYAKTDFIHCNKNGKYVVEVKSAQDFSISKIWKKNNLFQILVAMAFAKVKKGLLVGYSRKEPGNIITVQRRVMIHITTDILLTDCEIFMNKMVDGYIQFLMCYFLANGIRVCAGDSSYIRDRLLDKNRPNIENLQFRPQECKQECRFFIRNILGKDFFRGPLEAYSEQTLSNPKKLKTRRLFKILEAFKAAFRSEHSKESDQSLDKINSDTKNKVQLRDATMVAPPSAKNYNVHLTAADLDKLCTLKRFPLQSFLREVTL